METIHLPPIAVGAPFSESSAFHADQSVEYFSASNKKWYETVVLKVHADESLDLKCRKNVDPRLVRPRPDVRNALCPKNSRAPPIVSRSEPVYAIGAKVEYFSDTMNGWVLSYVRGMNEDGTYRLNSKKSALASRIRPLLTEPIPSASSKAKPAILAAKPLPASGWDRISCPGPFITAITLRTSNMAALEVSDYKKELCGSSVLGIGEECRIVRMSGFTGGQNEGIWFVVSAVSGRRQFCLKAVKSDRKFSSVPSERETYVDLMGRFSGIAKDSQLCFPVKIVQLVSFPSKAAVWDVIVMPVAAGERLAEVIGKIHKNKEKLKEVFAAVGGRLRMFHYEYAGAQHGDLQSSNIFVDLASMAVTLIDLGSMGRSHAKSDFEYFKESIVLLAKTYGQDFESVAMSAFSHSYHFG